MRLCSCAGLGGPDPRVTTWGSACFGPGPGRVACRPGRGWWPSEARQAWRGWRPRNTCPIDLFQNGQAQGFALPWLGPGVPDRAVAVAGKTVAGAKAQSGKGDFATGGRSVMPPAALRGLLAAWQAAGGKSIPSHQPVACLGSGAVKAKPRKRGRCASPDSGRRGVVRNLFCRALPKPPGVIRRSLPASIRVCPGRPVVAARCSTVAPFCRSPAERQA